MVQEISEDVFAHVAAHDSVCAVIARNASEGRTRTGPGCLGRVKRLLWLKNLSTDKNAFPRPIFKVHSAASGHISSALGPNESSNLVHDAVALLGLIEVALGAEGK